MRFVRFGIDRKASGLHNDCADAHRATRRTASTPFLSPDEKLIAEALT